jgi:hypothetical protein
MLIKSAGFISRLFSPKPVILGIRKKAAMYYFRLSGSPGDEADFRLVRNIAHRLKIHQLWSYQGGILQRSAGDL